MEIVAQQTIKENNKKSLDIANSVWVAASAGSGKTTILINRLLSLLINDVDISKVVCITYTKTAAYEMKNRIYNILSKWAVMKDSELEIEIRKIIYMQIITTDYLNKARTLFAKVIDNIDNLKIFTIHSFCQQIISRFPIEADVLPNFEVIDEYQSNNLIRQSIENLLLNLNKNDDLYFDIKNLILYNNEENFFNLINYLVSKRKNFEYMQEYDYRSDLKRVFNIKTENENDIFLNFINCNHNNLILLSERIQNGNFTDLEKKNFSYINFFYNNIESFIKNKNIEEYLKIFLKVDFKKRKFDNIIKKLNDDFLTDVLLSEQDRCYNFVQDSENIKYYKLTLNMINVNMKIIDNYKKLKFEKGVLDFDDLIMITLKLLQNTEYSTWVNYKLDNGIEHILVDEAQDTSILQWKIIANLTNDFFVGETKNENNRTLFVVGDEKQSIYRFQGANPQMFNEKYKFYKDLIENSKKNFYKINLQHSFRSLKTILEFVDTVFKDKEYVEKISRLDEKIIHNNIRQGIGLVELWPAIDVKKDKDKDSWTINFENTIETKKQELLAECIVKKIKYLISSDRAIINKVNRKRNIKYSDIMVLVKKRNPIFLSYLIRYLNKNNIPNSGYDKLNLFDNIVIQDIISLFKFVLFQEDDLSLANTIKSPILNLKEEDLYLLCKNRNDLTLFEAIKNNENYQEQYLFLTDIIEKSKILNIYDLCFYILEDCGIRVKILERFNKDINNILNKFLDFVKDYEKNNISSLLSFLFFLENNKNEIKKDLDSNDINQVKIMTIHASKGMQAPIVFVTDCNAQIDENEDEIFWLENQFEYDLPFYKKSSKSDIINYIKDYNGYNIHSEYFRLFYVAMTRAENELYLCSCSRRSNNADAIIKEDEKKNTWYNLSKQAMLLLNAKKISFDFNKNENKLVYGEENFCVEETLNTDKNKEYNGNIDNILNNIKKYQQKEEFKKIISPSQFFNHLDRDNFYNKINNISILKGNAVHKLLEVLPNTKNKDKIADIYLNNLFSTLTDIEKNNLKKEVISILENEKFKEFFVKNSKSELEIVGEVEDNGEKYIVSGKMDRFIEYEDRVLILDYKNTLKHYKERNDLPSNYIKQLELYKKLIEKIYNNKKIECYILITTWCELIKVF